MITPNMVNDNSLQTVAKSKCTPLSRIKVRKYVTADFIKSLLLNLALKHLKYFVTKCMKTFQLS